MPRRAEYIWMDGAEPTSKLRSKTRILPDEDLLLEELPEWGFDGSSTYQASGHDSDLILKPVRMIHDPIRGDDNILVLCEVFNPDDTPHKTNTRAKLRKAMDEGGRDAEILMGFEQEYTLMQSHRPLGWPDSGYPAPQGPFYCGVGDEEAFGRDVVEDHAEACLDAGLLIFGTNAEVMPGQWEFQIGYRGFEDDEIADPLTTCDHLWFARWLLYRIGEDYDVNATLDPKPVRGDWNGAGNHTNFSTRETRDKNKGMAAIEEAIKRLGQNHKRHISVYGAGLEARLTGKHETCSIHEFRAGASDRGASIRIPQAVAKAGYGYFEDRRPGANCDPYLVSAALIETVILGR